MAQPPHVIEFVEKMTPYAEKLSAESGIPFLVIMGQAAVESGWGQSRLFKESNNLFGIKLSGSSLKTAKMQESGEIVDNPVLYATGKDDEKGLSYFRAYTSPYESLKDHSALLTTSKRYKSLFDIPKDNYSGWFQGLQDKHYSTSDKYASSCTATVNKNIIPALKECFGEEEAQRLINNNVDSEVEMSDNDTLQNSTVAEQQAVIEKSIEGTEQDTQDISENGNNQDLNTQPQPEDTANKNKPDESSPEQELLKMLSGGGEGNESGEGQDIFSSLFSMLMMMALMYMINGKTKTDMRQAAANVIKEKRVDISDYNPDYDKTEVVLDNNGKMVIQATKDGNTISKPLSEADTDTLNTVLSADSQVSQDEKIKTVSNIVSKNVESMEIQQQLSDGFEMAASQSDTQQIARSV